MGVDKPVISQALPIEAFEVFARRYCVMSWQ